MNLASFDPSKVRNKKILCLNKKLKYIVRTQVGRRGFQNLPSSARAKFCIIDPGSAFKDYDIYRVQSLEEELEGPDSLSLHYWLTKFVQEVANKNGVRYPHLSVNEIVCGLKGYLDERNSLKVRH